ncbi:decaprenyl-phosphate phosphoribosyltransferase [Candidatus Aminicenantes bacterium AC-708-M15]|jgi:4-hydroxybenzoate polyprenyltransferase|nr:decaprenyl-phosphate phosphoribosyltransferase [SCandidatus Aminicenantes bacterium Aminicenantia_JdfR_composite]MCP2596802.1 decaprenyl-phosphate phosphoribosyltransferase [Candidatus Aminicenantes bacterium AC-335-G13]MCP2598263.1 decaprenyl-phosphate phosphoribosyltransferase [Candidatus Aminicenantes bacterium AC-335-L06]MCP2604002.1 decaprenyl-phosphate phosphoribosyltransferase [Candidatus Aminicenantes bacterium AC-708-M15]MCP2618505.1 decaprenyl-phosphate phosphoribosyltransferase [C
MALIEIIKSMRPNQWIKNLFIFAPLIFSQNIFNFPLLFKNIFAFIIFCLISGSLYIFNDLKDLEEDRLHPIKSKRPIASGRLKKQTAITSFIIISFTSFIFSAFLNKYFILILSFYFLLQLSYSLYLKHVVILDIFVIATGFLIRVVAGALAIQVYISSWLLICTGLLALFLAINKRRYELLFLKDDAQTHRPVLKEYNPYLLDQMTAAVTASTIIAYCLYTISEETVTKFGTKNLMFTIPFVLYGIFRYLYLIHHKGKGGSPEKLIITDKPLLLDILLWILVAVIVLYTK